MIENFRDWKILVLTLSMAPFFVFLMYAYFEDAARIYKVAFVNHDKGAVTAEGNTINAGELLVSEMAAVTYPDGGKMLEVSRETETADARERLKKKSVDVVVEIPGNFSRVLVDYQQGQKPPPALVRTYGDPANLNYMMAVVWCDALTYQYSADFTGHAGPLELKAETISDMKSISEFDLYVPGLLVLALICLMFTAAATLIKEKDKGTIIRLRLSSMTVTQWLSAVSLVQVIIGMLALVLTYLTTLSLGYETSGSLFAASVIGILSCLAIMAISLLVAAFLRTIFDLMTVGCFPFFILMFFSGGMMPLPPLRIFELAGRSINANDILPTTHSIKALGKILNSGAGLGDVGFEIAAVLVLTFVYFIAGLWLFKRRHLQPR